MIHVTDDNEPELKRAFASMRVQYPALSEFAIMQTILQANSWDGSEAIKYANLYKDDPEVAALMNEYRLQADEAKRPPTRNELIDDIQNEMKGFESEDAKIKGFALIADILGYKTKPNTTFNKVTDKRKVSNVIVLKDMTREQWLEKLRDNQRRLMSDAIE